MPIGARIRKQFQRPDPGLVSALSGYAVCDLADAMGRLQTVTPAIRAMQPGIRLAGPAVTVACRPDDNLMIHAAIDLAHPGDVIIVSAGGGVETALVGELITMWAARRGVAGFVIDGAVRDVESLAVPTFARGTTPRAPFRSAPGEIGFAVGLGGVAVHPGDLVVADSDGVVIVPRDDLAVVLQQVQAIAERDRISKAEMDAGTFDRSWVRTALEGAGVEEET